MDYEFNNVCGLTEEDVTVTLKDYVKVLAEANGMTIDECVQKLRTMYDGYHNNMMIIMISALDMVQSR